MSKIRRFFSNRLNRRLIRDYILIVLGTIIGALSFVFFLIPLHIVPGGMSGISIIFNKFFNTPFGLVMLGLNIPLFLAGLKFLGKVFGLRTAVGFILLSAFSDFFVYGLKIPPLTENILIGSIFGGLMVGIGLGLVFRGGGSTGGTDIIGRITGRYTNFSTGTGIMIVDAIIIIGAGLCFHSFDAIFYGFITMFIAAKVIDYVIEGTSYVRAAFIFSEIPDKISDVIAKKMQRGVTEFKSRGMYKGEEKTTLFCVVTKREIPQLRELVKEIDPECFMIITDVYEVLGRGFTPRGALKS
ncbi:YitT family protein [candidate division WOR-3 bacterium]|nr:YitT family protein [candidate division WOR-3 bacterium]